MADDFAALRAALEHERDQADARLAEALARLAEVEAERDACEQQAIDAEKACRTAEREARESKQDIESLTDDLSAVRIERDHFKARLAAVEAEAGHWFRQAELLREVNSKNFARLAAVETLCDRWEHPHGPCVRTEELRAAARGEGDRPAESCRCDFVHPMRVDNCPIHSGEGDRG